MSVQSDHVWTIGVEEEFFLLDPCTLDVTPAGSAVLGIACGDAGAVSPEMQACTVETKTGICDDGPQVLSELCVARAELLGRAELVGCKIASVGTHAFAQLSQPITEHAHYRDVLDNYGWVARSTMTCGLHVHVGVPSGQIAVDIHDELRIYLPILLALSANSPYLHDQDTGLASARSRLSQLYPRQGMPPAQHSWQTWENRLGMLSLAGFTQSHTDLWWSVRLQPQLGTIEVRVCDAQLDARHSAALAVLVQALCAQIAERIRNGRALLGRDMPLELLEENMWSAAQGGLDATLIDLETMHGHTAARAITVRAAAERLIGELEPTMDALGGAPLLPELNSLVAENGASIQRAWYENVGTTRSVTELVVDRVMQAHLSTPIAGNT